MNKAGALKSFLTVLRCALPLMAMPCKQVLAAGPDMVQLVEATRPLAFFTLDANSGSSLAGASAYHSLGGAISSPGGGPLADSGYLKLDGKDGYVLTTQKGGVASAGSVMAWVNLAVSPNDAHHILYLAGESENANDFDVQFEDATVLRFYTAGGGNLEFKPPAATLFNQWHMVVATLDTASKIRVLYWDGVKVASDTGGGRSNKIAPFSVGASTVFGGRYLKGGVQDAALWDRALSATEVS